ncbi:MAG: YtfJ family protein [Alistipes sp.]|nr:YtfJ family protein [Alistipes sp.]
MKKLFILLLLAAVPVLDAFAQLPLVTIRDSNDNPVPLPYFGEKHLLIFYVDPDHGNQNKEFTDYLEDNHIISENMYCFGIINLKDAPLLPNGVVRAAARKKEKKNDVIIYTDPDHLLRDAWQLGDVNNLFTIILISRDRELVWMKKGKLSKADQKEFFEVVGKYM